MEWYLYLAVVGAGFVCGFINTLAGSGSLITLPLLIFIGLPANVANGTNRVAILLQNLVGTASFHRQRVLDLRRGLLLAVPAIVGSILGAQIAVGMDKETMERAIGALMIVMLIVMLVRPKRWVEGNPASVTRRPGWMQLAVYFLIGIYGGFIQAGVGIFLIASLVLLSGYDLVRANAIKVLIISAFTVFALAIFLVHGQVNWVVGLIMAMGSMAGAWVAARMAVKRGARFVHWLLIIVIVVSAASLLDLHRLVARLF